MFDGVIGAIKKVAGKAQEAVQSSSTAKVEPQKSAEGSSSQSRTTEASTDSSQESARTTQASATSSQSSSRTTQASRDTGSSARDSVVLSAEAEDELDQGRTVNVRYDQEKDEQGQDAPDGTETLNDGTVVERRDGRTTTRKPDGTVIEEYRDGDAKVTETRYERDGAKVHEQERVLDNGDRKAVSTVEKDGRVETTVSETTHSDRDLEDVEPSALMCTGKDNDLLKEGQRNPTEVTHVTKTVTDNTKQPPESRQVLERNTYSQHIPLGDRNPEATGLSGDSLRIQGERHRRGPAPSYDTLDGVDIDRSQSGVTLAYSETVTTDENGQTHSTSESGSTRTIVGKKDGRDVQVTEANVRTLKDGEIKDVDSREIRGLLNRGGDKRYDVSRVGGIREKDEYAERLEDGPVDFRETEVYKVDPGGERHRESKTQEYGDYDDPTQQGRSVVITEQDDKKFWTYNRTDATDTGVRIQSQTSLQGSEAHVLSDTTLNRDGTFRTRTRQIDDEGVTTRVEERERRRVDPSEFADSTQYHGNQAYGEEFLKNNQGRQIYEDQVMVVDDADNYKNSFNQRTYSAEGSNDKLTTLSQTGTRSMTTILEDPDSDTPARLRVNDGPEFAIDSKDQAYVNVDGERVALPGGTDTAGGPGAKDALKSGASSSRKLYGAINNLGARELADLADNHPKLAGVLSTVGVVINGANIVQGAIDGNGGAVLGGSAGLSSSLGELSSLGSKVLTNSSLTGALKVGGRALGGAGAVLGYAYGLHQVANGEPVQGGFTIAAAAGSGLAVGATIAGASSWIPVAGWALAGVAVVGGFTYDLWHSHQEAHKTHDLQF